MDAVREIVAKMWPEVYYGMMVISVISVLVAIICDKKSLKNNASS